MNSLPVLRKWSARIVSTLCFLFLLHPSSSYVYPAERLSVMVAAESPPLHLIPAFCKPYESKIFSDQRTSAVAYFNELKGKAESISSLFFGAPNHIEIATTFFELTDVKAELEKIPKGKRDKYIIDVAGLRTVAYYEDFLKKIEKQDKFLFDPGIKLSGKYDLKTLCAKPDQDLSLLGKQFWEKESTRRTSRADYFSLVSWYLRERAKGHAPGDESFVPVIAYPGLFLSSKDAGAKAELANLLNKTSVSSELVKVAQKTSANISGQFFPFKNKQSTRPDSFLEKARKLRAGIVVWYSLKSDDLSGTVNTFIHELGHYLGLPHVFTDDKFAKLEKDEIVGPSCMNLIKNDSFNDTWDSSTNRQRIELCICFFEDANKEHPQQYEDFDGWEANIYDTALAIYDAKLGPGPANPRYFSDECKSSGIYKRHFQNKSQEASINHMSYFTKADKGKKPSVFTSDQKDLAKRMLQSFK